MASKEEIMTVERFYPIGTPNQAWNDIDKQTWLRQANQIQCSYQEDVVRRLHKGIKGFDVMRYGALTFDPDRYQLYCLKSGDWDHNKPTVLITGGVHGYEQSGVFGAIRFIESYAESYFEHFNFLAFPCVSPWGYETINRWNPYSIDPNRSFHHYSPSEEAANVIHFVQPYINNIIAHFDLHETTDTDASEFHPAIAARNGADFHPIKIPDGFYLIEDSERPEPEFQASIIKHVKKMTRIAQPDRQGTLFGTRFSQPGVVPQAIRPLGLCGGITKCRYHVTTEVYPDSVKTDRSTCEEVQVGAVIAGLNYLMRQ
jgi:hypothetical protein